MGTLQPCNALFSFHKRELGMQKEQGRTVETPVEARQGFLDRPVLLVLVVGVALVVIAFALVFMGFFGGPSAPPR
jgi:hypothetical protein